MRVFKLIALVVIGLWMGMSMTVDFVAVPLVFQTLTSLEDAGRLGMAVFGRFNAMEVVMGLIVFTLTLINFLKEKEKKLASLWLVSAIIIAGLAFTYHFYLTPQISFLGTQMHQFPLESEPYLKIYSEHQFYHKLYVKLDATKLIIQLICILSLIFNLKKTGEEI